MAPSSRFHPFVATLLLASFLSHGQEKAAAPSGPPAAISPVDLSLSLGVAGGGSTADNHALETLQGGAHDPKRNGFTLQQAELSLAGDLGELFSAEAHVLASEHGVELEEAFLTAPLTPTLELKGGYFLSEFGRSNASHPHSWTFVDQPLIATRLLGAEGLRNPGARIAWLLPVSWYSELYLGAQNADGDFAASFLGGEVAHDHGGEHAEEEADHDDHGEEDPEEDHDHAGDAHGGIGGRPIQDQNPRDAADLLYSVRWLNRTESDSGRVLQLGLSSLFGPNHTGGRTRIHGADLFAQWTDPQAGTGWPFLRLEAELMHRTFDADADGDLGKDTLKDWGYYAQLLYGFHTRWAFGARLEQAFGSGESAGGRDEDPYRSDRLRAGPILAYYPGGASRIRLQYNYDDVSSAQGGDEHTVWLAFDGLFGKHPPSRFCDGCLGGVHAH